MSFADERRAIENRFSSNFTATKVKYENVPFDQPDNASYVGLVILSGNGESTTIGVGGSGRRNRRYAGIIQVDIFSPEDGGTNAARVLADTIDAIFENVSFSAGGSGTITTRVPFFTTLGIENGWYHSVVSVAYQRDKTS